MKNIFTLFMLMLSFIARSQSIESISPSNASKGESIVLSVSSRNTSFTTGTNTVKLTSALYPAIQPTTVSVINDTLLQASFSFSSFNKVGQYDVVVINSLAVTSLSLSNAFELKAEVPVLVSVQPVVAKQADTVELTIKSQFTHFVQAIGNTIFLRNDQNPSETIYAFAVTVVDNTTIKGKFAFQYQHTVTDYNITILNSADKEISGLKKAFQLQPGPFPPQITSVTPNSAHKLDSVWVTVKGKNMFFKTDSSRVLLSCPTAIIPPLRVNYINDSVITALFWFNNIVTSTAYDIEISNRYGNFSSTKAFTLLENLNPPSIISIDPAEATQGDSILCKIKGKNTHFLKGTNLIVSLSSGNQPVSMVAVNDLLIEAKFKISYKDKPNTNYSMSTYDDIDGSLVYANFFTVKEGPHQPKLLAITPDNAVQGQKVDVTIQGNKNCFSVFNVEHVQFETSNNTIYAQKVSLINDSTLVATVELQVNPSTIGVYDVIVYGYQYGNIYTKLSLPSAFSVNKNPVSPVVLSVNPVSATQFDTVLVTIKTRGTHFLNSTNNILMSSNGNPTVYPKTMRVINDSTVQGTFILNSNYYASANQDIEIFSSLEGRIVKKDAFTIKKIYDREPRIISIDPKASSPGYSINMNITGVKETFRPGIIKARLTDFGVASIYASAVNYVNDSLITASFTFSDTAMIRSYYLVVDNLATLGYWSFSLNNFPSKLTAMTPAWASQTDSIAAVITGLKTHFNSASDQIWLQSKYATRINAFSVHATNDSITTARFAFTKKQFPGLYTLYLKSAVDKTTMKLKDAFTLTGTLNTTSLVDVWPKYVSANVKETITVKGSGTRFLTGMDTIYVVNVLPFTDQVVYPSKMKIVDDETITAAFTLPDGYYDIVTLGKEDYVLQGQLRATPPLSVPETKKEEILSIFPNPSEGIFTIAISENLLGATLNVCDVLGKVMVNQTKLESVTQLDLSDYPAGIYFVKLTKDNTCKAQKIIKL